MQVRPSAFPFACWLCARSDCTEGSMALCTWQLRHSNESLFFMRRHTFVAISCRFASNFSGVSTEPMMVWYTSDVALNFATSIGRGSRGTWQSEQMARTPLRFLSWMVSLYSANELSAISWHEIQNPSV